MSPSVCRVLEILRAQSHSAFGGGSARSRPFSCPCSRPGGALEGRLPLDPRRPSPGLALHSLPTAWGYTWSPYGRRKRAQRSPLAGGRKRPVPLPPPRPPAAPAHSSAGVGASTADGPRGARPRARAATRPRTLRRRGGRTPSRARTEPRTNPRAGRGGWWRLPCRPLTAGALPRRLCASAQATRGGVARGTRKGRCRRRADRRNQDGLLRIRYR